MLQLASVAIGALVLAGSFDQGWWPHDDGSLAHSAERVLNGELPHRDFTDLYTGLLTFLNATVFALFGEDIVNLRIPLFVAFLGFVASFFAIALRVSNQWLAFLATLVAIGWTVPVYPAPMPSWYLLFLSTIGAYFLVRHFDGGGNSRVFAAGACGGLAIAIKVVAIWYVVAVVLALLAAPLLAQDRTTLHRTMPRAYGVAVVASAGVAFAMVAMLISRQPGGGEVVGLLLPITVVCAVIALIGWRTTPAGTSVARSSAREITVFLVGVTVPIALLAAPYIATGSVTDLVTGVLVAPQSRFDFASWSMPHPATVLWAVPLAALLYLRPRVAARGRQLLDVAAGTTIVFLVVTAASEPSYSVLWGMSRALTPVVVTIGVLALLGRRSGQSDRDSAVTLLLLLVAGFSTLYQFPFAASVYFCYIAPLVALAGLAVVGRLRLSNGVLAVFLAALAIFGFRQLDRQPVETLGRTYKTDRQAAILAPGHASIRVYPSVAERYQRVQELVAKHRSVGETIFAGPDSPETISSPARRTRHPRSSTSWRHLDRREAGSSCSSLAGRSVSLVVINHRPEQSPRLDEWTLAALRKRYAGGERVDHFEVRWQA